MGKFTGRALIIGVAVLVCALSAGRVNAEQFFPTSLPNSTPVLPSRASGELDGIPINSGMFRDLLPTIPNLELGFQYFFGDRVRSNQANADYLLPYNLSPNSVIFGEAHGNWWNFTNKPVGGAGNRVDLSFGGGYRKILSDQLLVGLNGFYDTSRLFDQWYSSGSVGLELAANIGTSDAVDLNANWYGDIFSSTDIINAFRNRGGSYDIEAGYSHALFDNALDLRLKFAGYQFDTGSSVYGYKTGADLTTKDGMFMLRYEYGSDRINGQWNNIGAFVNVGFQMENVIKGESPFTMPEPIFKSPRNLKRMLTQKVKRDWNQQYAPGRAALAGAAVKGGFCRNTDGGEGNFTDDFVPVVPWTELDPDRYVTVAFYYENNTKGSITNITVVVKGPTDSVKTSKSVYVPDSGPVTVRLDSDLQQIFTDSKVNPSRISIENSNDLISVWTIVTCFNQP